MSISHCVKELSGGWCALAEFLVARFPCCCGFLGRTALQLVALLLFSFIAGALIIRYAWVAAGHVSSRDPQALGRRPDGHPGLSELGLSSG